MTAVAELSSESGYNLSIGRALRSDLQYALDLIHAVCRLAGSFSLIEDIRESLAAEDVLKAVRDHNSERLFEWFIANFSSGNLRRRSHVIYESARSFAVPGSREGPTSTAELPQAAHLLAL